MANLGGAVTFRGAADVPNCSAIVRMEHSLNVFVNSIPVSRQYDRNTPHKFPIADTCLIHSVPITHGAKTVKVNGRGCGRVGDNVGPNCTSVAEGSKNVFAWGEEG